MTFSIAAHDGDAFGVAVASRFVAVGSVVPAVRLGVGAVATQALARYAYRDELLDALATGTDVGAALHAATAADPGAAHRQVGAVGRTGAATFTGDECLAWAGGRASGGEDGAHAVQGNILTGPEVVDAMEAAFLAARGRLDERLLAALLAGDEAGGDSRGRQSAALLVHAPGAGYDGCGVLADLRVDDHPDAPIELARVHALATLVFGGPEDVAPLEGALRTEVVALLTAIGHPCGDGSTTVEQALEAWVSRENLENRLSPNGIDARVLAALRSASTC